MSLADQAWVANRPPPASMVVAINVASAIRAPRGDFGRVLSVINCSLPREDPQPVGAASRF
jgi:hypothetical protein